MSRWSGRSRLIAAGIAALLTASAGLLTYQLTTDAPQARSGARLVGHRPGMTSAGPDDQQGMGQAPSTGAAGPTPAVGSGATGGRTAGRPPGGGCGVISELLVPACGAWLGIWPRTRSDGTLSDDLSANLTSLEQRLGQPIGLVSRYYGWNQLPPDGIDTRWRDKGHLILIDLRARDFATNTYVQWRDVAAGAYDGYLTTVGQRLRGFGSKVFFSFNQEPELELERGEQVAGTAREFAAAYRHVHDVISRAGATNVVWVWWTMGWTGHLDWYHDLYPGDAYVDWASYDPYDFNQCHKTGYKSPKDTVTPFLAWLGASGIAAGKPVMLSEFGSNGTDRGAWYRDLGQQVKSMTRIKALVAFNSNPGGCDTRVTASPDNWQGFASIAQDAYFNPKVPPR